MLLEVDNSDLVGFFLAPPQDRLVDDVRGLCPSTTRYYQVVAQIVFGRLVSKEC
jgi:hypothetical protein